MSDTGNAGAPGTDWGKVADVVVEAVSALAALAVPGAAEGIAIADKIIQGVIAAEPQAVALFEQITTGTPPTPAQLQEFADNYEADYQDLKADIAQRLAALPAPTA